MISISPTIMRFGRRALEFAAKNAPKAMMFTGTLCVGIGTYEACKATLKADTIIEEHKARMDCIKKAKLIAAEEGHEYTAQDIARDKIQVYSSTAAKLLKLYGPAIGFELTGLGLMIGGFDITRKRHASALAALATLDQAFADYRNQVVETFGEEAAKALNSQPVNAIDIEKGGELPWEEGLSKENKEFVTIDPDKEDEDPFFMIFNKKNKNWYGDTGYLLNENFILRTIDAFNYQLHGGARDHIFLNEIRRALGGEENEVGHYYGYTNEVGDAVEVVLTPFLYAYNGEEDPQFPMMIPVTMEYIKSLELDDVRDGWGIGIQFKSPLGVGGVPRMIAKQVF